MICFFDPPLAYGHQLDAENVASHTVCNNGEGDVTTILDHFMITEKKRERVCVCVSVCLYVCTERIETRDRECVERQIECVHRDRARDRKS